MDGLWVSAFFIFVAELGDKSQLLAIALAGRYSAWPVLIGVTLATGLNHALSIGIGQLIGNSLSPHVLALVVGAAFVFFGAWTLRGDTLDDEEYGRKGATVVMIAFITFFLAELGDKTMFATITLATEYGALGTWLGSTAGMVAADALAILAGSYLLTRVSEDRIQTASALLFFGYGLWKLYTGLSQIVHLPAQDWLLIAGIVILTGVVSWLTSTVVRLRRRLVALEGSDSRTQAGN